MSDSIDPAALVGVPAMIVGQQSFLDWLASIGIDVCRVTLERVRRERGLPKMRDKQSIRTNVYPADLIRRYVRALVGVSAERWIEARLEDRSQGIQRSYRPCIVQKTFIRNVGCLYAMVARLPRVGYEQVVLLDGKMMLTRNPDEAALWQPDRALWHPRILRYDDVFSIDPRNPGNVKQGLHGRSASMLLCVYAIDSNGRASYCKVPSALVGYDRQDIEVDAVVPAASPLRKELIEYASNHNERVWVWVWRAPAEVDPVTLDPKSGKVSKRGETIDRIDVVDVFGAGPGEEPVERDASELFRDDLKR